MDVQVIQNKIYEIRGRRVMLDFDLAELYGVQTKALKQAVRRNIERFEGEDFMFELTEFECNSLNTSLRSQFVTSNEVYPNQMSNDRGGRRYMPFAFTEIGVSMLSSVLRSPAAIYANRAIMRAFVAMRDYLATTSQLTVELAELRTVVELLRRDGEETMEAVNDLSEFTREEIDNLYAAFAALSAKTPRLNKPHNPIGFKRSDG